MSRLPIDPRAAAVGVELSKMLKRGVDVAFDEFAPGVARLGIVFVNVYAVDLDDGRWFLVDTGLPGFASAVRSACEQRHDGRPPEAIVLTHAHFDHAGNAESLARDWGVPVYVHSREMPYVTGESDYAPGDPTPGGAIAQMSRLFPHGGYDFGRGRVRVLALPEDANDASTGHIPGLDGWSWHHTPGHTAGHVSLFRQRDGLLVAGDAVATMDLDSWPEQVRRRRQICRPAVPFTPDWPSARESIAKLADLEPTTVAAGHGLPLWGRYTAGEIRHLAETLNPPRHGRYAGEPATYDDEGRLQVVPPPPPDPQKPKITAAAAVAGAAVIGVGAIALFAASRRR